MSPQTENLLLKEYSAKLNVPVIQFSFLTNTVVFYCAYICQQSRDNETIAIKFHFG